MNETKNIIFDLGGVIINLDMNRTRDAFVALGIKDFDSIYTQAQQNNLFDNFDKGNISAADFRNELRKHIPSPVSDEQIDAAWDAMLLDVPAAKLELLNQLKGRYRLFLLSNTNEIHVKNFSAALEQHYGFSDFSPFFEKWYYSCNIGMRKPDAEIFQHVLDENNLRAEETVFIDDSIQHIHGAEACGIKTLFLEPPKTLHELLEEAGVMC
ncbi:MAG TPA: HAD family phosphatase [Bacteroidia bacterium]|nr:HAD family phosphatase [Bacteroidia bacterium]